MLDILNIAVSWVLYLFMLMAVYMIFFPLMDITKYHEIRMLPKSNNLIYRHLRNLYISLYGETAEVKLHRGIGMSFIVYILCIVLFGRSIHISSSLLVASIPIVFMYCMLRVRVYSKQVEGSYEGISYTAELLNQYQIHNQNMIEALAQCIRYIDNCPNVQSQTYRLSMKLKLYTRDDDMRQMVDEFANAINTHWADMISNSIFLSLTTGQDVTKSLEDILIELKRIKLVHEKSYQNTSEGFLIIKYILPILYIGSVYMGIHYFNLSMKQYINYQFSTPLGLKMFAINLLLFGINILLMMIFKRRKFDIK